MIDRTLVPFVTGLLERFEPMTDRVNPILVKEVRQVLRGRNFVWSFVAMVVIAAGIGAIFVISDNAAPSPVLGPSFLGWMLGVLALGLIVMVPLQTFQSLGSEWEGDNMEQLALSGLTPRGITAGKWWSGVLQSLILVAAFAPFVALGFLMRGVDLGALVFAVAMLFTFSVWGSSLALALSSLSQRRVVRGLVFAIAGVGLFMAFVGTMALTLSMLNEPGFFSDSEFLAAVITFFLVGSGAAAYCHEVASGRLSHPEENASTPLRTLVLVAVLGFVVWLGVAAWRAWIPSQAIAYLANSLTVVVALVGLIWATERGRLGRRVAAGLARRGSRSRRLPALLLPGGGRGFTFGLVTTAGAAAFAVLAHGPGDFGLGSGRWFGVWVLCYYAFYVGLPSLLLSRLCVREFGVWITRFAAVIAVACGVLVPAIVGIVFEVPELQFGQQAFNVFWVLGSAFDGPLHPNVAVGVALLGIVGVLANVPRIMKGLLEVSRARAGRIVENDPAVARSREIAARAN
jgi:hypothetical protein